MGVLAFWAWGTLSTLAPTHIGWVMSGMDTPSQYLGWQFFRFAPWHWPPGLNPTYGADAPGSIVLSDSIPLLALPLKLFSAWLPVHFQYFGAWVLSCFLLQGWFAYLLIRRVSGDSVLQLAGAAFFLTASIFLVQAYFHPSLGAQWVLLAGLLLTLGGKFRTRAWCALLCLTILVHAYLFVMLGVLWCGDMAQRLWRRETSWPTLVIHAFLSTGLLLGLMWLAGYFVPMSTEPQIYLGYTDLSFPFWPGMQGYPGWSRFVPTKDVDVLALNGFGYFGLGFMLLCLIAAASGLPRRSKVDSEGGEPKASTWGVLLLGCGLLFLFAVGSSVHFYGHLLFSYPIPAWLHRLHATFRAAGRMMWPLWYLALFGCLYILSRRFRPFWIRCFIALALLIQLVDISQAFHNGKIARAWRPPWHATLTAPVWSRMAHRFEHVVFLKPEDISPGKITTLQGYKSVARYAARNRMTINVAYMARMDEKRLAAARHRHIQDLERGDAEPGTLYVIAADDLWSRLKCTHPGSLWYGRVDGLDLIAGKSTIQAPESEVGVSMCKR